ncbi:hypothetical protein ACIRSS_33790 [Amycolatopsis sp. NPDC101161]|uniref:hypothetical protein n=1 Tax=Amycolatopsis sp. NPDC101161 TaxID=3363940 RepID=UPI003829D120
MISTLKSAGAAAIIGIAAAGVLGLAGPAVANAQTSSPAGVQDCGLSQGVLHWAYTNCGNSPALVRFQHVPLHGSQWSNTLCIAKGAVVTVGNAALESISATPLQGPCIP